VQPGEVWWVEFDQRRPVVLLSGDEASGFQVVQVVAAADVSISDWGIEVALGAGEGLPFEGVVRFAFPRPGYTPCTWLTTLSPDDLLERGCHPSLRAATGVDPRDRREVQRDKGHPPSRRARLTEADHPRLACPSPLELNQISGRLIS
jgi:mRNA interferase MazF